MKEPWNPRRRGARPLADIASAVIDPVLRRKAGMATDLIAAWPEIAGARLSAATRPLRLEWPRKYGEDDLFSPATLVIAAEPAAALRLQHQTSEVLTGVNRFLGYGAVARIKLVQMPVEGPKPSKRVPTRPLNAEDLKRVEAMTAGIEDEGLRETMVAFAKASLQRQIRKD